MKKQIVIIDPVCGRLFGDGCGVTNYGISCVFVGSSFIRGLMRDVYATVGETGRRKRHTCPDCGKMSSFIYCVTDSTANQQAIKAMTEAIAVDIYQKEPLHA